MELTIKCPKCGRQGVPVSRDGKLCATRSGSRDAIALALECFVESLSCEATAREGAVADAQERLRKATAALAVAREIGGADAE